LRTVIVIGGGLAGLVSGIRLAKAGISCTLIEKKSYPLHRVCGEYVSNECKPFLQRNEIYPEEFSPPQINRFQLSSSSGRVSQIPLDLGGFGISRFSFDHFLYQKARALGVNFLLTEEVQAVQFQDHRFWVSTEARQLECDVVIGAFGKRSRLDGFLKRKFMSRRSPYAGVKYHLKSDNPSHLISLHNFAGGYCGMSNVEQNITNLCYLTHRDNLRKYGSISAMEEAVLFKNPLLKDIFKNSQFLFTRPEVINEISFETKDPVEQHVLMAGDAAGMITPLCGNGMAMAVRAAGMVTDQVFAFCEGKISREEMERAYDRQWRKEFSRRLWNGRQIQKLFGNAFTSNMAVNLALHVRPVADTIVRNTHGEVF
jgi:flavin-dependent dehydrogenase